MLSLITHAKAQKDLAANTRANRLQIGLTQEGLARRAGVPLPTLRKFEQKGIISLESFLKIQMALGRLEDILGATQVKEAPSSFSSIDEVLKAVNTPSRKRNFYVHEMPAGSVNPPPRKRGWRK